MFQRLKKTQNAKTNAAQIQEAKRCLELRCSLSCFPGKLKYVLFYFHKFMLSDALKLKLDAGGVSMF